MFNAEEHYEFCDSALIKGEIESLSCHVIITGKWLS